MRNVCAIVLIGLSFYCCADFNSVLRFFGAVANQGVLGKEAQTASRILQPQNNIQTDGNYLEAINNPRKKVIPSILQKFQLKKQRTGLLKKEDVFSKEEVKAVEVSFDGKQVVCLIKEGKNRYLKSISIDKKDNSQIIREKYPIDNFVLLGKNILYTYHDKNGFIKVKIRTTFYTNQLLSLPEKLRSVRFFKNDEECLAECYDEEGYMLYNIKRDARTGKFLCDELKKLNGPVQSLFDKDLNPILVIKNENGLTNVYVSGNQVTDQFDKKEVHQSDQSDEDALYDEEDDLSEVNNLEEDDNLILLDQIQNANLEKYFSVDKYGNCYKASINKINNSLLIEKRNIGKETKPIYKLRNISSFSQIIINTDQNGGPSFVSVNSKRYQHYSWNAAIKSHLKTISDRFSYGSWYRVNTTSDGSIWLICVVCDRLKKQFFLYDTKEKKFTFIKTNSNISKAYTINDYKANEYNLQPITCHYFRSKEKRYVQMFLIQGAKKITNTPLIIMLNSTGQYRWEYMPIVQILADRGFNVLCLNCRNPEIGFEEALHNIVNQDGSEKNTDDGELLYEYDEDDDKTIIYDGENDIYYGRGIHLEDIEKSSQIVEESVVNAVDDIEGAIAWIKEKKLAKGGNIILLTKKHSIIPAMRLFWKYQKSFAGCIAISSSEDDIKLISNFDFDNISKPLLLLGRFNNSELINSFMEKVLNNEELENKISVISYKEAPDQKVTAGIVEAFLAKNFSAKFEHLPKEDVSSLEIIQDGLSIEEYLHGLKSRKAESNMVTKYRVL